MAKRRLTRWAAVTTGGILLFVAGGLAHQYVSPQPMASVAAATATAAKPAVPPAPPAIHAPNHELTWSVDFSGWEVAHLGASYYSRFIDEINQVLLDPRGWSAAGLRFQFVPSAADAQIVYRPRVERYMNDRCAQNDKGEWACPAGLTICPVGGSPCTIDLVDTIYLDDILKGWRSVWVQLVNHETGHSLGLGHYDGGVMNAGL
jgi:hypothetical protein